MPKAVFAVTNIKVDSGPEGWFAAGSRIDVSKFTKEQLVELHDAGAVEIRVIDEEPTDGVKEEAAETPAPVVSTESEGASTETGEEVAPVEP